MARKKAEPKAVQPKEPAERPTTASPPAGQPAAGSKLAEWSATELARVEEQKAAEAAELQTPDAPLLAEAEEIAELVAGEPVALELLSAELLPKMNGAIVDAIDELLPIGQRMLDSVRRYADGMAEIEVGCKRDSKDRPIPGTGKKFRLFTLRQDPGPPLTGWRRKEMLAILADVAGLWKDTGRDTLSVASHILRSDKSTLFLGLVYAPVGEPYDRDKAREYGELIEEVLTTEQLGGVLLRFFSLSDSFTLSDTRNYLVSQMPMVTSFIATRGVRFLRWIRKFSGK